MARCHDYRVAVQRQCILKTASARVVAVHDRGIELDRTIFCPLGGGQLGDTGTLLRANGQRISIADTRKGDAIDSVLHIPADAMPQPEIGETLALEIDWAPVCPPFTLDGGPSRSPRGSHEVAECRQRPGDQRQKAKGGRQYGDLLVTSRILESIIRRMFRTAKGRAIEGRRKAQRAVFDGRRGLSTESCGTWLWAGTKKYRALISKSVNSNTVQTILPDGDWTARIARCFPRWESHKWPCPSSIMRPHLPVSCPPISSGSRRSSATPPAPRDKQSASRPPAAGRPRKPDRNGRPGI